MKVGFIGLGTMGAGIALNAIKGGHELVVSDMGVKAGLPAEALWSAVRQRALGRRRVFDTMARQFLPGRFDPPDFALKLARKDVSLALEVAREYDVPMRLGNLTLAELTEAMNRGWEQRDSRSAMILQEERAGAQVRIAADRIDAIMKQG